MDVSLAAFVAELRAVGLPVSVSENVDAAAALRAIPLADRDQVKSALAATLVKNHDHYRAFELAFDIFFGGRQLARLAEGNGGGEASRFSNVSKRAAARAGDRRSGAASRLASR